MPSINMIAPRRAERKRLETNVRRLLLAIVVELVLIAGVAGLMITRIYTTRSMIDDLQVQLTKLQPTVRRIELCEKSTRDLSPKLDTLKGAKAETTTWCRILDQLSISLPENTWLTRISTPVGQAATKGAVVNLNGFSASQDLVGDAMLRMRDNVSDFASIDLHYTQKGVVGHSTAVEFELAAGIKGPAKNGPGKEEVQKS